MGSCQGNCFHQKIRSLLFQRPGSRQQPQIFRSGQFRLGCRFRLQLSGQLQIPAAQVVQQAVSGGDVCVHCGRGISLCQQSLPPCLQSIQDDLLVRRQIVVECLQFCGSKTARSLPGALGDSDPPNRPGCSLHLPLHRLLSAVLPPFDTPRLFSHCSSPINEINILSQKISTAPFFLHKLLLL